jgi:phosphoribosylaminoimidazole-succinocarboxamide synthase
LLSNESGAEPKGKHPAILVAKLCGELSLCDEVLTPDSSRFWPAATWNPGGPQLSYDKQFVRDYLETLSWNKQPPAPQLPPNIIDKTSVKYLEAYHALTGKQL